MIHNVRFYSKIMWKKKYQLAACEVYSQWGRPWRGGERLVSETESWFINCSEGTQNIGSFLLIAILTSSAFLKRSPYVGALAACGTGGIHSKKFLTCSLHGMPRGVFQPAYGDVRWISHILLARLFKVTARSISLFTEPSHCCIHVSVCSRSSEGRSSEGWDLRCRLASFLRPAYSWKELVWRTVDSCLKAKVFMGILNSDTQSHWKANHCIMWEPVGSFALEWKKNGQLSLRVLQSGLKYMHGVVQVPIYS